ncbi:GspH/FimT family pseudopilin [Nitrospira sp. BLG_2]|uniref:GspH/FimT family pseudopilin n=1 Tax=Nitrospira sp. BLG_2 TaxID=3397507 RepID=UPI003B9D3E5B
MKQEGKTLTELMVVVAIIGLVATMAVPNYSIFNSRTQVRCTIEEIASELRLARQLAMTYRDRVRIVVDLEQQALTTQFVNAATTHHAYHYGGKGVVIEEPSGGPEILFHPSGRSASPTTIQLHSLEGQTQQLTVSITGRVSLL